MYNNNKTIVDHLPFSDKLSKKIYENLLILSQTNDIFYLEKALKLCGIKLDPAYYWYNSLKEKERNGIKLILYGIGEIAKAHENAEMQRRNSPGYLYFPFLGDINWFGICDKNSNKSPQCFCERKLMSFEDLLSLKDDNICVCIGAPDYFDEIKEELIECGIPNEKIVKHIYPHTLCYEEKQYFDDFMEIKDETVFIDGGCFRCDSIERFIKWNASGGHKYKKIISYEPDLTNYMICKEIIKEKSWKNIELYNAGLSDKTYTCNFIENGNDTSYANEQGNEFSRMISIDESANGNNISFIKLDIEGFELKALIGAKEIIKKYHPRMAISLYHRKDDLIKIPQYILKLSNDYKFYLRIYSNAYLEIILYAI